MLMTATRAVLRTLARSSLNPHRVVSEANNTISGDMPDGRFVTLLFVEFNPVDATVCYTSAGHEGFLLNSAGDVIHRMESHGLPLSVLEDSEYEPLTRLTMAPGDILLLFTDGIPESMDAEGTMFGTDGMLETVRQNASLPATGIVEALFETASNYRDGSPQADDVTALVLKRDID